MNFVINSLFIDIVITFILLLMLIFGYFKGFVYRAYDLVATIISLLAALYGSSPLSNLYTIYEVTGLGEAVGKVVNRFIIFIIPVFRREHHESLVPNLILKPPTP